jgi:hypothetical protein
MKAGVDDEISFPLTCCAVLSSFCFRMLRTNTAVPFSQRAVSLELSPLDLKTK